MFEIGEVVKIRDKKLPFDPLIGVVEAISNCEIQVRFTENYNRTVWIDTLKYRVEGVG